MRGATGSAGASASTIDLSACTAGGEGEATVAEKFERIVEVGGRIAQTSTIRWNFSAAVAPNIANHILILKPCIVALECGAARLNLLHGYHVMAVGAQAASGPCNGH